MFRAGPDERCRELAHATPPVMDVDFDGLLRCAGRHIEIHEGVDRGCGEQVSRQRRGAVDKLRALCDGDVADK